LITFVNITPNKVKLLTLDAVNVTVITFEETVYNNVWVPVKSTHEVVFVSCNSMGMVIIR